MVLCRADRGITARDASIISAVDRGNKPVPGHHRFYFLQIQRATGIDDSGHLPEIFRPDERRRHEGQCFGVGRIQIVEFMHHPTEDTTKGPVRFPSSWFILDALCIQHCGRAQNPVPRFAVRFASTHLPQCRVHTSGGGRISSPSRLGILIAGGKSSYCRGLPPA